MESFRSCLRCGARNAPEAVSCRRCGEKLRGIKVAAKGVKKQTRLSKTAADPVSVRSTPAADKIEFNKIHNGHCLDVMRGLPDNSVDLIVTSPPYNFGLDDYDAHRDTKSWQEYFQTMKQVFAESLRLLKPGGRICVVVQPLFSDYVPTHHIISQQLHEMGFLFKAELIWEKHNYNCKYTAWGSWKSPSMPYLKYTWEFIEVFCKGMQKKAGSADLVDVTADEFKKWVYARWEIAPESRMKDFDHPAMFPEEIPYRLIRLFSYVGDIVLDPFNGVGTTTLVARKLGRKYIGIDVSEAYCRKARQRIQEYERQPGSP